MNVNIRQANPSDAEQIISFIQRSIGEPNSNIVLSPNEFTITVAEEEILLDQHKLSKTSIYLVAEVEKTIVGILSCTGNKRKVFQHVTELGMIVDQEWRNNMIGTKLLAHAIEWAKRTGILKRIELYVFERNKVAIHLYEKFGFKLEGRRKKAVFRGGEYIDDFMMALLL